MNISTNNSLNTLRLVNPTPEIKPPQMPGQVAAAKKAYGAGEGLPPAAIYEPSAPALPSAAGDTAAAPRLERIQQKLVGGTTHVPIHFDSGPKVIPQASAAAKAYSRFVADPANVNASQTNIQLDA